MRKAFLIFFVSFFMMSCSNSLCVVSFDTDGGSTIGSYSINRGEKIVRPDDPSKKYCIFIDWYKDEAMTQIFDFDNETADSGEVTIYAKWDYPLNITAISDDVEIYLEKVNNPGEMSLMYSNDFRSWNEYVMGDIIYLDNEGDRVYFRAKGKNDSIGRNAGSYRFVCGEDADTDMRISVSGNIMSLLDDSLSEKSIKNPYAFNYLFYQCYALEDASALELNAVELSDYCYSGLFHSCANLKHPVLALPAEEVKTGSYSTMFSECVSLKTAPLVSATKLAESCYRDMFVNCKSMEEIPVLKADPAEFAGCDNCYTSMFKGCIKVDVASASDSAYGQTLVKLPADINTYAKDMFNGTKNEPALSGGETIYTSNPVIGSIDE